MLALAGASKHKNYMSRLCTLSHYMYMINLEPTCPPCLVSVCIAALRAFSCDIFKLFSLLNYRPSQHGADLLSLLSKLLDENTKPGETENHSSVVTVSLALQALEELCKAEVCLVKP